MTSPKPNTHKNLEERIQCPVHEHLKDTNIHLDVLQLYNLISNDCNKCEGYDRDCEIYAHWLMRKRIKEQGTDGYPFET